MNDFPWWIILAPAIHSLVKILFVLVAGTVQGRTTGRWPTLDEWMSAAARLQARVSPFGGQQAKWPTGPSPDEGDGPINRADPTSR